MGFFDGLVDFAKFHGGDVWDSIKDDPERMLLGAATPIGSEVWGGVLGEDWDPMVSMTGGATSDQFKRAEAEGIDTGPSQQVGAVADTIASIWGGGAAAGALGGIGSAGGAAGGGGAGATGGIYGQAATGAPIASGAPIATGGVYGQAATGAPIASGGVYGQAATGAAQGGLYGNAATGAPVEGGGGVLGNMDIGSLQKLMGNMQGGQGQGQQQQRQPPPAPNMLGRGSPGTQQVPGNLATGPQWNSQQNLPNLGLLAGGAGYGIR